MNHFLTEMHIALQTLSSAHDSARAGYFAVTSCTLANGDKSSSCFGTGFGRGADSRIMGKIFLYSRFTLLFLPRTGGSVD